MINRSQLFEELEAWNDFLRKRVHLIACGGTSMTLMGIKESTKDIDFIVPVIEEYNYLTSILKQIGYKSDGMLMYLILDLYLIYSRETVYLQRNYWKALWSKITIYLSENGTIYILDL